ncbi:hypothetical protein KCU74_g9, partial [Aureobasidium melanogenum]
MAANKTASILRLLNNKTAIGCLHSSGTGPPWAEAMMVGQKVALSRMGCTISRDRYPMERWKFSFVVSFVRNCYRDKTTGCVSSRLNFDLTCRDEKTPSRSPLAMSRRNSTSKRR